MFAIRIMMHLNTTTDSAGMKCWTAAVLATGGLQSTPAATAADIAGEGGLAETSTGADNATGAAADPAAIQSGSPSTNNGTAAVLAAEAAEANILGSSGPGARLHTRVSTLQRLVPALPSSVLKVLVLYMQYMLVISSLQVEWPGSLSGPFTALAVLWGGASSEALAVECLMPGRQAAVLDAAPPGVLRVVLLVIAPIVSFCALIACECLWRVTKPWIMPAVHKFPAKHVVAKLGGLGCIPSSARW
eukprot:GHUV01003876.1.p1 GENE.GHUV01003876.1~~GHUV01003876.1.p1  ORF type:complete len:246 (+),score=71.72 GHUV01003876.1:1795-2532(+)